MSKLRVVRIVSCLFVAAMLVTACSDDGDSTTAAPATLTVASLTKTAAPALGDKATTCPLPYDMKAAAKAAGINGAVALDDFSPVSVNTSASAPAGDYLKQIAPAVNIECRYQINGTIVHTGMLATAKAKSAVAASLPSIVAWSDSNLSDMTAFIKKSTAAKVGTAISVPSGKGAVVKLKVTDGDGVLVVGVEPAGANSITPEQIAKLTMTLGTQIR
jgi:hypothetical protein